ncbi:MAG TPA: haloacid dehalogenase-like hydrolase [Polyangiaceae bacterium]|nr:haloacid dehalogenase-like hydrolase [Polyangiaceae bacterium]
MNERLAYSESFQWRPSKKLGLLTALLLASACASPTAPPAATPSVANVEVAVPAPAPSVTPVPAPQAAEPLPSWNDGATKQAILKFVAAVTTPGGKDFVPVPERIATFDNDGTLWSEQPIYIQFAFILDRVRELAPQHPEWKNKEPFKSVLAGDLKTALAGGEKGLLELAFATHAGMTTDDFSRIVTRWFETAKHPKNGRLYTDCVYQPMLELLAFLRANGFKTFIASGGGVEFMRVITEKVYGIPPEQVIGTTGKMKFELRDGKAEIVREPALTFVNDKDGKPVGIELHIGRRPIAAFGNSDGDQQMLEWTASGPGARLMLLVRHTDGEREVAYDRASSIGKLDKALDEAKTKGWVVASMKDDWKTIFPALATAPALPASATSAP